MDRTAPTFYVQVKPQGTQEAEPIDSTDLIKTLEYEDDEEKADKLTLTVRNDDLSHFDNPIFKEGNTLIVSWGYPGRMTPPRECTISKVTGSLELKVEAQGGETLMNRQTKQRSWENMTRSAVVREIATAQGYSADRQDIEDTEEVFEVITQSRETDAQFVRRLAGIEGFQFYEDGGTFHFHKRRYGQQPTRTLQYYLPPDVGDIITFNVTNDIFAKPKKKAGKVKVKGRDPIQKKDIEETGSDSDTPRDKLAPVPTDGPEGTIDPTTGEAKALPDEAKPTTEERPTTAKTPTAAKREANASYRSMQEASVELDLDLIGDPVIVAKALYECRLVSKRLSGLYHFKNVKTTIGSGYTLKVKAISDGTHGHTGKVDGSAKSVKQDGDKDESKGKVNTKTIEEISDPDALVEEEGTIDPITGKPTTIYKDKSGSGQGKK